MHRNKQENVPCNINFQFQSKMIHCTKKVNFTFGQYCQIIWNTQLFKFHVWPTKLATFII